MERSEHEGGAVASGVVELTVAFFATRRLTDFPEESVQLGAVWSACEQCAARWDAAAAHFEEGLRDGRAAAPEVRRTQLAYVRLLLARGAPGDDVTAERLLAEVNASVRLARAAGPVAAVADAGAAAGSGRRADPVAPRRGSATARSLRYLFRREGDYWTLACNGKVSRLRSLRGFDYIAELLRHPYEQIYVVDLAALGVPGEDRLSAEEVAEHGLRVSGEAGVVPALDRRAREDYRARWRELLVEEAAARRDNDPGRAARVQREIAMLTAQLAAVAGGSGCGRSGTSLKERARVNVRNCITGALRAVRVHDEALWRHLSNSIKTGSFCCYGPDRPVVWDM